MRFSFRSIQVCHTVVYVRLRSIQNNSSSLNYPILRTGDLFHNIIFEHHELSAHLFRVSTKVYIPSFPPGVVSNSSNVRPPTLISHNGPHGVYTPDVWVHALGIPYATTNRSGVKPRCVKVPSLNGDPQNTKLANFHLNVQSVYPQRGEF